MLTVYQRHTHTIQCHAPSLPPSLPPSGPDIIVCDEGHVMRNAVSNLSIILQKVRTLTRIVLTGTPLQNNLVECKLMVLYVQSAPSLIPYYTLSASSYMLLCDCVCICMYMSHYISNCTLQCLASLIGQILPLVERVYS